MRVGVCVRVGVFVCGVCVQLRRLYGGDRGDHDHVVNMIVVVVAAERSSSGGGGWKVVMEWSGCLP